MNPCNPIADPTKEKGSETMSKKGGSKKDLFQNIAFLKEDLSAIRDQNITLLNAVKSALQTPTHDKNCWALQKKAPGPCTCHIADLENARARVEGK